MGEEEEEKKERKKNREGGGKEEREEEKMRRSWRKCGREEKGAKKWMTCISEIAMVVSAEALICTLLLFHTVWDTRLHPQCV